jgi:hypothetical protein
MQARRTSIRHLKGRQIPVTLYLPPRKSWLLKALSHKNEEPMQRLLRRALDDVLAQAHRESLGIR